MHDHPTEPAPPTAPDVDLAPLPPPSPPRRATSDAPPPPPPPPPAWTPPPVAWSIPAASGRSTIELGSILGRSFDTFGREWSLFLALAAPAALGAFLQSILAPATSAASAASTQAQALTLDEVWPMLAAFAVSALFGLLSAACVTVAADALWRGSPTGVGQAVAGGLRALPRYLGVVVVLGLVIAGAVLAASALLILLFGALGSAGVGAFVIGVVVLLPVLAWVGARLSLLAPVIVLERNGVLGSVRRAWGLSKGHALVLFVLSIAIGLAAALPLWGGSMFAAFVEDPLIAGIAMAIATFVYQPLPVIAMTLAWGDRIGGRHADSELMARGRGRGAAVALVLGLGAILLVVGSGVAAQYASSAGPAFP